MVGLLACVLVQPTMADGRHEVDLAQDAFIDGLLQQMTVEEKISQLRLVSVGSDHPKDVLMADIRAGKVGGVFNTVTRPDIRLLQDQVKESRLEIPLFFAYDVTHGHRTAFPISLGLASSWDLDVIHRSGRISALEASADGLDMTFSPMIDVTREPRWGRASEGFGEDAYLTSRIADVLVRAYQGEDLAHPESIMAVFKHFAIYGGTEGGRDYNTVDMSPQRMFQDYLPPYKAAVDAGAGAAMTSLSALNGMPGSANTWLLQDVLRKQWGFNGLVISDHGAVMELMRHGVAASAADAAQMSITAGTDMNMNDDFYQSQLPDLVQSGKVSMASLDAAARNVLVAKYRLGLFDDPYRRAGVAADDPEDRNAESRLHRDDARDVARRSMVLLKNADDTLPLKKEGTIAVVGPLADSQGDIVGSWSAAALPKQAVTVLDGITRALADNGRVLYAKGANVSDDPLIQNFINAYEVVSPVDTRSAGAMIEEAVSIANRSDVIVAVVGEARGMADESASRSSLQVPKSQQDLIAALRATGKPLVLVLLNGRPLALEWEHEQADAMLETWFPGTEGGNAIADILFGDYNPAGKLPMTFPRTVGQVPIYYNHLNSGRPFRPENSGKYTSNYFDEEHGPLYPFGYGLSYTKFEVSPIRLSSKTMGRDGRVRASVTVSNTGKRSGETVVQLYLRDLVASISRPVQELKGFEKIALDAGETRDVSFDIDVESLKFFNAALKFDAEPGDFEVMIGLDSANVHSQVFTLQN
jgi:beta-glucosidase